MAAVLAENNLSKQELEEQQETLLIQQDYRKLLNTIKDKMDDVDQKNVRLAFEMAVDAHKEQRRKSGEPYILHPIEVARICVEEIGLGPTAVICALLHDVVEDTSVTLKDIQEKFGDRGVAIAKIVDGLTKLDSSQIQESKQAENFRKVLKTLVDDVRVVLIKMADRLHNMRTLKHMPKHKQLRIASETSFIYAPLAHRLGLHTIKTEFEDLCMKITEPDQYKFIAKKLNETKQARHDYIDRFIEPLKEPLDELNIKYRIVGRPKSIYSINNKIKKKKVAFEQIYDLFAIRILIDVPPRQERFSCWWVYSIVSDVYQPIPERLKDFIARPKSNGYESLHTTVSGPDGRFVEVQIRTERMNEIAERGFAAHWKYKGDTPQPDVYDVWLDSVRDVLENPESDAMEFIYDFKNNLFQDEVYVFTPTGEMKTIPKGATALDFAFWIHSDLGYHCTAVKVNDKIMPMGTELHNGDQVTIISKSTQKPSKDWLDMVSTSKAKSRIRSAMKEEQKEIGEFGKEALERKLRNAKVNFEEAVELLLKHFNYKSRIDLFYDIATDVRTIPSIFKEFVAEEGELKLREAPVKAVQAPKEQKELPQKQSSKLGLFINGEPAERFEYQLATCCNPVQGDDVFAYLTTNAGLKIHRTTCPNAENLMANYGHRVMKADWMTTSNSTFVADLKITGIDTGKGVIERLTNQISSKLKLNIRSMNIKGYQGYFEADLSLLVANRDQLYLAVNALQNLENVSTVIRVK